LRGLEREHAVLYDAARQRVFAVLEAQHQERQALVARVDRDSDLERAHIRGFAVRDGQPDAVRQHERVACERLADPRAEQVERLLVEQHEIRDAEHRLAADLSDHGHARQRVDQGARDVVFKPEQVLPVDPAVQRGDVHAAGHVDRQRVAL